jgi:hypothetical protein
MESQHYYNAKQVYPSDKGLHMEFGSPELALEFYEDGSSRGITYELDGSTVIKPFKIKKRNPIPEETEMGQTG